MPFKLEISNKIATFNKYGWHLQWPRGWIITLGLILLFLCLCIAGMEIGHTVFDLYRSTAFAGFIVFIPLLICVIFILITAYMPHRILLRIATILCCIMIILCIALIAYDILVLIDPTRCFFLNCDNAAVIYQLNSTYTETITGWPIYIPWPNYFRTNMNVKRIFQSIQLLCSALFILFCSLYILTYIIYRRINLHQSTIYSFDQGTFTTQETTISPNNTAHLYPPYNRNHVISRYNFKDYPSTSVKYTNSATFVIEDTKTVSSNEICRRCMREPRMIITANYGQEKLFSYVCIQCNDELLNYRGSSPIVYPTWTAF